MSNDSLASARQIREPVDHSDKIHSAFDSITYRKGGGVLAMLERYVGEDKFQAGVRLHMDRHADGTATAEDFIASLAEGSERLEIEGAFKTFIEQPGIPLLSVSLDCEDDQNPRLNVQQARYAPLGSAIDPEESEWQIPMCVSYTADGATRSSCALLSNKQQSIDLDAASCPTQLHPNANGSGYYRFSLDEAGWQALITSALSLPAAEAMVLADSLDAGFRAGVVSADTYVSGMVTLTQHDAWDVADSVTDYFESIADVVDPDQLESVQKAFQKIVRPRFTTLENASDSGSMLLRQRMQRFLVVIARDPDMRAPLAAQAAAVIGFEQEADPAAAPASQYETIFSVGVQDLGEPYFDLMLERLVASEDPQFRYAASGALARVEDPVLVKKLQKAGLDGKFKQSEFRFIVSRQMARQTTTELTFAWLLEHTDEIISEITGGLATRIIPSLGSSFCTVERANDWQAFVTDHAEQMPGYERQLAQALESVHLCAALRDASSAELVAAFEKI
jgi:aminopeptidase N